MKDILEEDRVVDRLKATLVKAVVIDRRKHPSYGYRAVHIIATARNRPIEIQVRTELQHLWAQLSEKLSDAHGLAIKYGGGDPDVRKRLSEMSDLIGSFESLESVLVAAELAGKVGQLSEDLTGKVGQLKRRIRQLLENAIAT